jgi:hypothetical protein
MASKTLSARSLFGVLVIAACGGSNGGGSSSQVTTTITSVRVTCSPNAIFAGQTTQPGGGASNIATFAVTSKP